MFRFILLFSLLFSLTNFAQETAEAPSEIVLFLANIKKEIAMISDTEKEIKLHEKEIYDFKIKFSDLLSQFIVNNSYSNRFIKRKTDLLDLEKKIEIWRKDANTKLERLADLNVLLKNYSEKAKEENDKESKVSIKKSIKDLYRSKRAFTKHLIVLKEFSGDINKWKKFFSEKAKKGFNRDLLQWNLSDVFFSPLSSFYDLVKSIKVVNEEFAKSSITSLFRENKRVVLARVFLVVTISFIFLYALRVGNSFLFGGKDDHVTDTVLVELFKSILNAKKIFLISPLLLLFIKDLGILSYKDEYSFIYLLGPFVVTSIWIGIVHPVINIFAREVDSSKYNSLWKVRISPIVLIIFLIGFKAAYGIEGGVLSLLISLLVSWVSLKFIFLCKWYNVDKVSYSVESVALFVKSARVLVFLFSSIIFIASILEIVGFSFLGKSIQLVIAGNIILLSCGWVLYHFVMAYMNRQIGNSSKSDNSDFLTLLGFIKNSVGVLFIASSLVIILKSWHNTIFVFTDFWNLSLFHMGGYNFTIDKPFKLVFFYILLRMIYLITVYILDSHVMDKLNIQRNNSKNLFIAIRYMLILIYAIIVSGVLGMTYKNIVIIFGALGVGIGFGLQNIVNNFISGVVLMFEQPIRVGDIIDSNGFFAKVRHIGMRSTIVETYDNSSIVIPNSEILSNKLTNWTLNGNVMALKCEVGVAYGTDVARVKEILHEVADNNKDVLKRPESQVWFTEFGDSSLNFTLKCWISKPLHIYLVRSALMEGISEAFARESIKIPFPQRDIHISHVEDSLSPKAIK